MTSHHLSSDVDGSALALLAAQHRTVRALFLRFANSAADDDDAGKAALVDDLCQALSLHATLEDEIFYPALRTVMVDDELLDEADVEHASARELVARLEIMYPGDDHFDATVAVLADEVSRHIDKEESVLFEAARQSGIDLVRLGARLAARRDALDTDIAAPPDERGPLTPHNGTRHAPRPPD